MSARDLVAVSVPVMEDLKRLKEEGGHSSLDSVIRTLISEHKWLIQKGVV